MKPNLYICHTAYQVLVDLLRAGRCAGRPHTMVLSASVPDTAALAARLDATGVVKTVLVDETRWPGTVAGLFAHRRAARAFVDLCEGRHGPAHQLIYFTCHPHVAEMLRETQTGSALFTVENGAISRSFTE